MMNRPANPAILQLTALSYVLLGLFGLGKMVFAALFSHQVGIEFTALGVAIGPMLLRRRPKWRIVALVYSLACVGAFVFVATVLGVIPYLAAHFRSPPVSGAGLSAPTWAGMVVTLFMGLLQVHVLTRSGIRDLFRKGAVQQAASADRAPVVGPSGVSES